MAQAYPKNPKFSIQGQETRRLIPSLSYPIASISLSAWMTIGPLLPAIAQQMPSLKPAETNTSRTNTSGTNPSGTLPPPRPRSAPQAQRYPSQPQVQRYPIQQVQRVPIQPPPTAMRPIEEAYTLGPGDAIQIDIFNVPEYSGGNGQYEVLVDGKINMPLIGEVFVEGLTLPELTARLRRAYQPFLQHPEFLTVKLLAKRPLQIGIAGEVRRPGSYTMGAVPGGQTQVPTIAQVIQLAGGITQSANIRQIQLRRRQVGKPDQFTTLNLAGLIQLGDLSQDITLRDGDTIFIPTATTFNPFEASDLASATLSGEASEPINIVVVGEVSRPGSYTVTRIDGTGGTLTVTRALQTAGGVSLSSDIGNIEVIRRPRAGSPQTIIVNLWDMVERGNLLQDLILQEGDTIVVPTLPPENYDQARAVKLATSNFAADTSQPLKIAVVGEVTRPGTYTVGTGGGAAADPNTGMAGGFIGLTRLTLALQTAGGVSLSADIGNIEVIRRPKAGGEQIISVNLWDMVEGGDLSQDLILQQGDTIVVPTLPPQDYDQARAVKLARSNFAADTSQPFKIAVVGEVTRPGTYTVGAGGGGGEVGAGGLIGLTRLTLALQTAGGVTLSADIGNIEVIRRPKAGGEQIISVNLWDMVDRGDLSQDLILQQGDTIMIPTISAENFDQTQTLKLATSNFAADTSQALNVAIVGEVNRPGTYTVGNGGGGPVGADGLTGAVGGLIGLTTVTRAIQTAGGITPVADIRQIQVRRQRKDGSEQSIDLDLWQLLETGELSNDIILQQGDTIVVPTATNIDLAEAPQVALASFAPIAIRVNIVGEVLSPGTIELPPNTSLNQALLASGGFNNSRAQKDEVELIRLNPNGTVSKEVVPVDFSQGLDEQTNPTLRNGDVIVVGRSGLAKTRDTLGEVGGTIGAVTSPVLSVFGFLNFFQLFRGNN